MAKPTSVFTCQNCGFESAKWLGQCPSCQAWNTFVEEERPIKGKKQAGAAPKAASVVSFAQVRTRQDALQRIRSGMEEFDRVLGGGIVFGSVNLIGGEPGIGKSTLLTQLVLNLLKNKQEKEKKNKTKSEQKDTSTPILYIAGEESPEQIALRIERMEEVGSHTSTNWKESLLFVTSTDVDEVTAAIEREKPLVAIVDSIQTLSTTDLTGSQGSVGQLKECTERLTAVAKRTRIPLFLVGHVTKEGTIAGPKVLEHIVDCVLELSGERSGQFRILRAIKNRFGATDEVGLFEVIEEGLREVTNPSATLIEESTKGVPGAAIVCVVEGTRPILLEVQALVVHSPLAVPRRVARGIPIQKLQILTAVLEKYCSLPLSTCDVFVNVAGGITISETAADLGVALACVSSFHSTPLPSQMALVGEVGLLGEVRPVKLLPKREKEAARLGYERFLGPRHVKSLRQALELILPTAMKGKKSFS